MVAADQEISSPWHALKYKAVQKLQAPGSSDHAESFFVIIFQALLLLCSSLLLAQRFLSRPDFSPEFLLFQSRYYFSYFLSFASDALQWPYLYALYESYGFSAEEIACHVAFYFLAAAAAAPVVGAMTGRKLKDLRFYYGVATVIGCLTVWSNSFWILMLGRICSGIAMAILSTAFEAWMVSEHLVLGFRGEWLYATFCGLSFGTPVVMLAMGAASNIGVHAARGGFSAPNHLSILPAIINVVLSSLDRSKGSSSSGSIFPLAAIQSAWTTLKQDKTIRLLALLETTCGTPLLLVFLLWAPTIIDDGRSIPLGLLFACMAVCSMIGSTVAGFLTAGGSLRQHLFSLTAFQFVAGLALAIPIGTQEEDLQLLAFCTFFFCGGIISPALARLRSLYIPEGNRGAITGLLKSFACILTAVAVYFGRSTSTLLLCVLLSMASVPLLASSSKRSRAGKSSAASSKRSREGVFHDCKELRVLWPATRRLVSGESPEKAGEGWRDTDFGFQNTFG